MTRKKTLATGVAIALISTSGGATALASGGAHGPTGLDDGKELAGQAKISLSAAVAAAQTRASGGLNEVDLEHADGRLVYNVDVGSRDVEVDALDGKVLLVDSDD